MDFSVKNALSDRGMLAAVCIAYGIAVRPSSAELQAQLQELVARRKAEEFPPQSVKDAVRGLLKTGGFKPSGRNKPASEYLAQAAREHRFPVINNLVDVNNLISLTTGLPISLLDADACGAELLLRYGREGERYVFNAGGQEIDLEGLICSCNAGTDAPLGNPIKDSLAGKIKDTTTAVIGIMYAPVAGPLSDVARAELETFARLLEREGGATRVETVLA
jgi:DNA/RNA-binding domain of Phe-tRNA-synthetase-like protein